MSHGNCLLPAIYLEIALEKRDNPSMAQCDLHQNLNYGCYLWLTLESAPSDLDLLPLKAPAIIVASDLELTRKLISVTIGNVKMYARLRLRPFISFKGMKGKFLFALVPILPCTGHQRSALAVATVQAV